MQVAQYLFQSPSTSQVQIGRLDPSTKEDTSTNTQQQSAVPAKTAAEIMTGKSVETPEITPKVNPNQLLDVYA